MSRAAGARAPQTVEFKREKCHGRRFDSTTGTHASNTTSMWNILENITNYCLIASLNGASDK